MPIDGHRPGPPRRSFLKVCTPCNDGEHARCGPLWDLERQRVLYCECPGWDDPQRNKVLVLLPCLPLRGAR